MLLFDPFQAVFRIRIKLDLWIQIQTGKDPQKNHVHLLLKIQNPSRLRRTTLQLFMAIKTLGPEPGSGFIKNWFKIQI
jgi:hypothetical protein